MGFVGGVASHSQLLNQPHRPSYGKMIRIMGFSLPFAGHVRPNVATLIELQRRGYDVVSVTALAGKDAKGERFGIRTREVHVPRGAGRSSEQYFGGPFAEVVRCLIAEEQPDLLLMDPSVHGAMTAAEASGRPWVMMGHSPAHLRGTGPDARGPGLWPLSGWRGWLRDSLVERWQQISRRKLMAAINEVRLDFGLDPLKRNRDRFHLAPLTIAFTAEPFEYPRKDWPESVRFVGPVDWDVPAARPPWIEELRGKPLVLVTTSTFLAARDLRSSTNRLVNAARLALAGEPYWVVMTIPAGDLPDDLPPHMRATPVFPHGDLLTDAICVICQGGAGITQRALAAGVPVVAVPGGYDRYEVARRLEVAGAGVSLPEAELTPKKLRLAVRTAIGCKPAATEIACALKDAGGVCAAADAIERLLNRLTSRSDAGPERFSSYGG